MRLIGNYHFFIRNNKDDVAFGFLIGVIYLDRGGERYKGIKICFGPISFCLEKEDNI